MKKIIYIILFISIIFIPNKAFAQQGWNSDENGTYYISSSTRLTGRQVINGKEYYFNEQGVMQKGFITIDGKLYFYSRVNGVLKTGWQGASEGQWYQNSKGEVLTGDQTINNNKYYFNEQGILQKGFVTKNGKLYFYSRVNGALKTGWQGASEGQWYQKSNGEVVTGHQTINNNKYYFNEQGIMQKGFVTLNGKIYFYSRVNGALKTGWQGASEGEWFQNANGEVVTGHQTINNNKYYFNEQGMMQKGFVTIDDKLYFYSRVNGALKTGVQGANGEVWVQNKDGEVMFGEGVKEVEGKEYFFQGRNLKSGIIEVDGIRFYFDNITFEKRTKSVKTKYYDLIIDDNTGEFIKKQYKPVYYNQKDWRWSEIVYGNRTFGMTGCAPAGMAMAYTSILQREILPTEVADYLYYQTDQYNRYLPGTSGMGIIYASNKYGVKWTGIGSKDEMIRALKQGKIIYASMQDGKYAKPTYNHIIMMYDYNESKNQTYTLDPLLTSNNGWNDVNQIWREQCMDPDDRTGGYAFYSLEEK